MNTITKKAINVTVSVLVLFSVSACVSTQTTPSMVDYSYVPPSSGISTVTTPGIEAY
jgi:hypothetical protein